MEYRKIIEFGKSSYVVSLPKSWVQKNNLNKGDLLYAEAEGRRITLRCKEDEAVREEKKMELDVTNMPIKEIKIRIVSLYIKNYNEIILKSKDLGQKAKDIRAMIHDLMALEVVEETATKIVTKDFLNMNEISPESLINKMDLITRDMLKDSRNSFKEDRSQNISERDADVNRLSYLVARSLKHLSKNPKQVREFGLAHDDTMVMWNLSNRIESIADQAKRIAKLMRRLKMSDDEKKTFSSLYAQVEKYYLAAMEIYYKRDIDKAIVEAVNAGKIMKQLRDYYRSNWDVDWMPIIIEQLKTIVGSSKLLLVDIGDMEYKR